MLHHQALYLRYRGSIGAQAHYITASLAEVNTDINVVVAFNDLDLHQNHMLSPRHRSLLHTSIPHTLPRPLLYHECTCPEVRIQLDKLSKLGHRGGQGVEIVRAHVDGKAQIGWI